MVTTQKATASKTDDMMNDAGETVRRAAEDAAAPMREMAEKGVAQAKESYGRFKSAAEEASDAMEDAYATMSKGYKELGRKSLEATRANANAHFDFLNALLASKSLSQAIELQTSYARKQFDVMGAQAKDISALAQKAVTDGSKPMQEIATKGMKVSQTR